MHVTGENARVNIHSIDNSSNTVTYGSRDFEALASEFTKLRIKLLENAHGPEDYAAIGAIASAEIATKTNDSAKLSKALSELRPVGKWVIGTATAIGAGLAVEAIKKAIGM